MATHIQNGGESRQLGESSEQFIDSMLAVGRVPAPYAVTLEALLFSGSTTAEQLNQAVPDALRALMRQAR